MGPSGEVQMYGVRGPKGPTVLLVDPALGLGVLYVLEHSVCDHAAPWQALCAPGSSLSHCAVQGCRLHQWRFTWGPDGVHTLQLRSVKRPDGQQPSTQCALLLPLPLRPPQLPVLRHMGGAGMCSPAKKTV